MDHITTKFLLCITFAVATESGGGPVQQFFRTTPQDSFVEEGGRAIINCVIGDLGGRVQWTKDGLTLGYYRELPGFPRYSVQGSDESGVFNLQILDAKLEDEAVYECQVGPNGTNKPIRAHAKLNVLLPPTKAEILGHKHNSQLVVQEQEEVELVCRVYNARPRPDIIWYLGDSEFSEGKREDIDDEGTLPERITVSSTLRFKTTQYENQKNIACEAHHPALTREPLRAAVKIFVQYPPEPPEIVGYRNREPLKKGDTVTLVCISRGGNPLATLTWFKNGARVDSSYTTIENGSKNTYEFTASEDDNNAEYSCQSTNEIVVKPMESSVTTVVRYGPQKVEIIGPVEAIKDEVLTFECSTSDSNPPVDIWWVIDGRPVQGNQTQQIPTERGTWKTLTNIELKVRPSLRSINIQCHAVNQEVAVTKVASHIVNVLYPPGAPKITGYTEGEQLTEGKMRRIVCTSSGGNPLATIKWYKGSQEVPSRYNNGDNYASSTLDLQVNMTDNKQIFKCEVTSKVMMEPLFQTIKTNVQFAPGYVAITVMPNVVRIGDHATLSCESGESNPPAGLVWLFKGEVLSAGKQIFSEGYFGGHTTKSRLMVDVKSRDDSNVYTCKAYNKFGEALDAVILPIAYKPEFPTISSPIEIKEGDTFVHNFSAEASPSRLDYKWEKDMEGTLSTGSDADIWFDGGILHIPHVTREHAGTFTIKANNSEGMAMTKVKLEVFFSPRIVSLTEPVLVNSGEDAHFECRFESNPIDFDGIKWLKQEVGTTNEMELKADSKTIFISEKEIKANTVTSKLTLKNVTIAEAGKIVCSISNGVGEESEEETYLLLKYKPVMIDSPILKKSAASNGETGIMKCQAQGSPNITFTWRRQTGELAGGSKYKVMHRMIDPLTWESQFHVIDVNPTDYGIYECAARNTMGVSYQRVMLDMPSRPDIPIEVSVDSSTSHSAVLKWIPGFGGGSPQIYRVKYYPASYISDQTNGRVIVVDVGGETSYVVSGLRSSTKYMFTVQSVNDIGESKYTLTVEGWTKKGENDPLVDGLIDTSSQSVPIFVTISIGVCATLLLLLSVVLIICLIYKKQSRKTCKSQSFNSDNSKPSVQDGFSESQGTSCYNDTMSEETMSYISERSGSLISAQDRGSSGPNFHTMLDEGYHPHAASTYLTEQVGGIYSVEQSREIGFTSQNLPLSKNNFTEETESQYADELRRQAYIQTLGDGYNISQIGSSISYPNSPTAEYSRNNGIVETGDLQHNEDSIVQISERISTSQLYKGNPYRHQNVIVNRPLDSNENRAFSATLGRNSLRNGSIKSPFQVVVPSAAHTLHRGDHLVTPPVCSTPENSLPILKTLLESGDRVLPEFSTFGNQSNGLVNKQRNEAIESNGQLV